MTTKAKSASPTVIERLASLRDGIRSLFKVIRTARVVLRHLEACLIELYKVSDTEIETVESPHLIPTDTIADSDETVAAPSRGTYGP